tara:strand:+ start:800 stop:1057 length:258 start_codon:yes stop_codon:yes gene_type:complete
MSKNSESYMEDYIDIDKVENSKNKSWGPPYSMSYGYDERSKDKTITNRDPGDENDFKDRRKKERRVKNYRINAAILNRREKDRRD